MEAITWITPRSFFSKESQSAFDLYDQYKGDLRPFSKAQLSALWSQPAYQQDIELELQRRKDEAEEQREAAHRARVQAPAARRPALTGADVDACADELSAAMVKVVKSGDAAPLHEAFRKYGDTAKYPPFLVTEMLLGCVEVLFQRAHTSNEKNTARNTQLAAHEARLNGLEESPAKAAGPVVRYCGIWVGTEKYGEGALTTHRGGLWLAKQESICKRPGIEHDAWVLVVKSGQAE
jgi:hypothetical protein